ncbi:MAG: ABC transporter ATP-binding protein [Termitinemataceae bacterium]|nr:MAG: ABC transporter ATP-binding protein [Termitinemataceae bacterium]
MLREFKTLFPYFSKYKSKYIAGFICLFAVDAAQLIIPQFTKTAINLISAGDFLFTDVLKLCLLMVGAMLIISSGRFLWRLFIHGSSRRIESELRQKLFDHLLSLSWDFYQKNNTGDLIARSTNDIGAVRMAIGWGFVAGIDGTVMALSLMIIMFVQSWYVAIIAIIPLPIITVLIIIFGKMVGGRFKKAQEKYSALSTTVQETFSGIRVVKSFVKESWFVKKFAQNNDDYRNASMSVVKIHGFFMPMITFLAGFTSLLVLLAGGYRVVIGQMSPGELVALFSYVNMLVWPMLGAGFTVNIVQRGAVSLKRINEVLNSKPSIKNQVQSTVGGTAPLPTKVCAANVFSAPPAVLGEQPPIIKIQNLNFSYGDKTILSDVNLELQEGKWLGILGRTGSGKTTLIKLLPRLLDPPPGTIFIKGKDVRNWDLSELRKTFGLSPQDSFMFSDSVRNNLVYGLGWDTESQNTKKPNEALIARMLDLAALTKDMQVFSDGIDTVIGERGLTLSGGQKQRLAIARAAIVQSEILILDDSLSAVDAQSEQHILQMLQAERKGKTTIIISHRVSAFANTDIIAVIDKGKIVEQGNSTELCNLGAYYAKTARLQQLGT